SDASNSPSSGSLNRSMNPACALASAKAAAKTRIGAGFISQPGVGARRAPLGTSRSSSWGGNHRVTRRQGQWPQGAEGSGGLLGHRAIDAFRELVVVERLGVERDRSRGEGGMHHAGIRVRGDEDEGKG